MRAHCASAAVAELQQQMDDLKLRMRAASAREDPSEALALQQLLPALHGQLQAQLAMRLRYGLPPETFALEVSRQEEEWESARAQVYAINQLAREREEQARAHAI